MNDIYLEVENPQDCEVSVDVGITDYNNLEGRPQINGVTLEDNKTGSDLGLADLTDFQTLQGRVSETEGGIEYLVSAVNELDEDKADKTELATKQDRLIAGQNITIIDNIISATGGGGKTFRLLNTVTGGGLQAISRNLDDKGQPFHYKDLIIEFTHPATNRSPVFYLNDNYGTADGFAAISQLGINKIYFFTNSVNNLFYAPIAVSSNGTTSKVMTPKFAPPHADNLLAVTQHTGWSCTYAYNGNSVTIRVWGDDE